MNERERYVQEREAMYREGPLVRLRWPGFLVGYECGFLLRRIRLIGHDHGCPEFGAEWHHWPNECTCGYLSLYDRLQCGHKRAIGPARDWLALRLRGEAA